MRKDYDNHIDECSRCSARQRFHRKLDLALVAFTSLLALFSLIALVALRHFKPSDHVAMRILGLYISDAYYLFLSVAIAGVFLSMTAFLLVFTATPVPSYLGTIATERVRRIGNRLPGTTKSLCPPKDELDRKRPETSCVREVSLR